MVSLRDGMLSLVGFGDTDFSGRSEESEEDDSANGGDCWRNSCTI